MRGRCEHVGKRVRRLLIAFSTLCVILLPSARAENDPSTASNEVCTLRPGPTRTVARVIDGETLLLDDGREVRLIGALAPRAEDAGAPPDAWPMETEAIRLLTGLVLGQSVRLAYGARKSDRYGRHLAHVFVKDRGGADLWVQGEMLRQGAARAYGLPQSFECATELSAHERVAREARLGVWSLRLYDVAPARDTYRLMRRRSRFQIVGGAVTDVARTKRAIYLNFGDNWRTDFTARIGKDVAAAHPEFDRTLDVLKGRRIEVRGWIERRNGPLIDVDDPSQIALVDDRGPALAGRRDGAVTPADADEDDVRDRADPGGRREADVPAKEKRPDDPLGTLPGALDL